MGWNVWAYHRWFKEPHWTNKFPEISDGNLISCWEYQGEGRPDIFNAIRNLADNARSAVTNRWWRVASTQGHYASKGHNLQIAYERQSCTFRGNAFKSSYHDQQRLTNY